MENDYKVTQTTTKGRKMSKKDSTIPQKDTN